MAQEIITAGSYYPIRPPEEALGWKGVKQFLFVIFKWQRLIVSLFLAFTVAAGVAMYLKPTVRRATAKLIFKKNRTALRISGLTTTGSKLDYSPQVMQSEIELMKSREVLLTVAKKLLSRNGKGEKALAEREIESMVSSLKKNTVPVAIPDTNVIQVTYFARTSEEAERTLGLIVDQYIEQQALVETGSGKLLKFYEEQKEMAGAKLREAEEQFREWQEKNDTISIDEQVTGQLKMLRDRKRSLSKAETLMVQTLAKMAVIKSQLSSLPERLVTERMRVKNPLVTRLKDDLVTAEVALQDLLQRYMAKDRRVQEKREQVNLLKRKLALVEKEGEIIGRETTELNPLRETLLKGLAGNQAQMASLVSRKGILLKQIREMSAVIPVLREKKVEVDRRSSRVEFHKEAFKLYGEKMNVARIATGLGKAQLANVAVIEQPHAKSESDLKNRIMMVLLAAFVGLALGMTIALGLEFFNNSLRSQEDVEYYLGLPMLAAIPDLRDRPLALER